MGVCREFPALREPGCPCPLTTGGLLPVKFIAAEGRHKIFEFLIFDTCNSCPTIHREKLPLLFSEMIL